MVWIWLVLIVVGLIIWKLLYVKSYWKRHSVVYADSFSTAVLDAITILTRQRSLGDQVLKSYKATLNSRYYGTFQFFAPVLFLKDPDLIKQITVKDFDSFVDHRAFIPEDVEPLFGKNLIGLKGQKWRDMRATLSPSFTSSKMKAMFVLMSECAGKLAEHFVSDGRKVVDVELKDLYTRYANDVIASSAFGVTCDSIKDRNNEFYTMGADATNFKGFWRNFKFLTISVCPFLYKILGIGLFPKRVSKFFISLVKETLEIREKQGIVRPDMIHLLMEARKGRLSYEEDAEAQKDTGFATVEESHVGKSSEVQKKKITDTDIAAQALIFFFAGFDTISTAMSFMSYELAVNPDIQERLHQEITDTLEKTGGKISYESLVKMKYLDMVISETLRKWPPSFGTDRVCTDSFTIEPQSEDEQPVLLDKGDSVFLPIYALHRDEKYFPNPDRFDPERFNDENKHKIVPYTYAPFGIGPRACIGSRFALLEMKALFVNLLKKCELVVTEKTEIPLKLSKKQFTMTPENGFWVGIKPRNN